MEKTASVRKFHQPMGSQIKAFHDNVKHKHIGETVMNHLQQLNREEQILSQAGGTMYDKTAAFGVTQFSQVAGSTVMSRFSE